MSGRGRGSVLACGHSFAAEWPAMYADALQIALVALAIGERNGRAQRRAIGILRGRRRPPRRPWIDGPGPDRRGRGV